MSSDNYTLGAPMTGVAGAGIIVSNTSIDGLMIAATAIMVGGLILLGLWVRRKSRRI